MKIVLAMLMVSYLASAGPIYSRRDNDVGGDVDYIVWHLQRPVVTDEGVEVFGALLTSKGIVRCVGYETQKSRRVVFGKVPTTANQTLWSAAKKLTQTVRAQRKPEPGQTPNSLAIVQSGSCWELFDFSVDESASEFVQRLRIAISEMKAVKLESLPPAEFKAIKELRRLNKIDPRGAQDNRGQPRTEQEGNIQLESGNR